MRQGNKRELKVLSGRGVDKRTFRAAVQEGRECVRVSGVGENEIENKARRRERGKQY